MTFTQALKLAAARLTAGRINLPHLEAEILLSGILRKPREFLLAHGEKALTNIQYTKYKIQISRRLKGEPIAYITGHKEFYGLDFLVNKNVLIPRPETELMVDEAANLVAHNSQLVTLIDVGTGSGCIIIALAKLIKNYQPERPVRMARPGGLKITNYKLTGTDISSEALTVARKNAQLHRISKQIKFIRGDLLKPIVYNHKFVIRNSKLIILSNLPYLTPSQIQNSPTIKYEPKLALAAGADGLKYYQKLFQQIQALRVTRCALRDVTVFCEIDPRQTELMRQLVKRYFPKASLEIKKDLAGLDRLAIIRKL